ncbi:hypothetical protein TVAG_496080 [Trichomonas vaginalis G3]|uniref:Uncharacterized protein n=1 Tax=Trichomonas vaginalis (strain ATCC PRA-98 / G3) TaxID=412133 RepID=A2DVP7_TRIV3|nr:armadillo (ARM) repeat-containing protein family [Trichomonas vaginalis G3]EAY15589.1 hypothetical protein TVAG_496080 [Trichomonas vaginalis G3]KAI5526235.1 armadillo (ARM) repeat-containing protein family [Trichomonas vaginalis G3]|eukprot:XP_001327812.1 hypothetical protein [Trichomonas vaginalis G3]
MYKEEDEVTKNGTYDHAIILNNDFVVQGIDYDNNDLFSLLDTVRELSKKEDDENLLQALKDTDMFCSSVQLSSQLSSISSDFFVLLVEIFLNFNDSIEILILHIFHSILEHEKEPVNEMNLLIEENFIQKVQNLIYTHHNIEELNAIVQFISVICSFSPEFRDNYLLILNPTDIFNELVSNDQERRVLFTSLVESFLNFEMEPSFYEIILQIAKQSINLEPLMKVINKIFDYSPQIIMSSDIFEIIFDQMEKGLINPHLMQPYLNFYTKYLDFTQNDISKPPVFLVDLILSDSKQICNSAAVLIVRLVEYAERIVPFLLKAKLLENTCEIIFNNKTSQKVDGIHILLSLVKTCGSDIIIKLLKIQNEDKINIISFIASLISADLPELASVIIELFDTLFNQGLDGNIMRKILKNFIKGEGKKNCEDLYDELDDVNDPDSTFSEKISGILSFIEESDSAIHNDYSSDDEYEENHRILNDISEDNDDYGYSDPEEHQINRIAEIYQMRAEKMNQNPPEIYEDENIEDSEPNEEEESGFW